MKTKKIIAISLSAIICSAIMTPVASADDIDKKAKEAAEEAVRNLRKKGIYKSRSNYKPIKYDCTYLIAKDQKGNMYDSGDTEKGKENLRKMAQQNGWNIKERKGTCIK